MTPQDKTDIVMALREVARGIEQNSANHLDLMRAIGTELRFRAAANGELGSEAALRDRPDVIVADEIASRAGAFALAKQLRDANDPYPGVIVILLERKHDAWLAEWSGADAWFVKPVDPFELADRLLELVSEKESA